MINTPSLRGMKRYPNLYALLTRELGTQAPSMEKIEHMAGQIKAEHPGAVWLVFYKNGHWILLPVGPGQFLETLGAARKHKVKPGRNPIAYCPAP